MGPILIVDDDGTLRASLCRLLGAQGYAARGVGDGESALRAMRAERPALVLLDVMMPGLTGLDVLRAARADPSLAGVPIVMLTANNDDETRNLATRLGAREFLVKGRHWPESLCHVVGKLVDADPPAAVPASGPADHGRRSTDRSL